ncbi:hypothetical protein IFM89_015698 [Coptis chinensis]|uniref:cytokinin riboside 5'-monophosphate phosphoribohydrolase n=1 Tax=Coptis chinensis TaxID=261450 RepID=A0A835I9X7_9MAGN|nr:hypothetical protein IFM89_015698 [Coptis chinensis]
MILARLDLVYGGGGVGLMGLVSRAVHHGGGHVLGIIPKTLMGKESPFISILCKMEELFVYLGGYGTLEELLEVITWAQLGIQDKPDGVRTLLDVASELPDNELLLQKHFTAVMSSIWRASQSKQVSFCALCDVVNIKEQDAVFPPRHNTKEALTEVDKLEVTLELLADKEDFGTPLPSTINLSIFGSYPPLPTDSNGEYRYGLFLECC